MDGTLLLLGALLLAVGVLLRIRENRSPTGKRAKAMGILAFLGYLMAMLGAMDLVWPLLPQTQTWAWGLQIGALVLTVAVAFWLLVPTWKK